LFAYEPPEQLANLDDAKRPVAERNGAWPYGIQQWIPRDLIESLSKTLDRAGDR